MLSAAFSVLSGGGSGGRRTPAAQNESSRPAGGTEPILAEDDWCLEMSDHQREIYHSENGDRWLLCRDDDGRVFVLHRANVSSGGTETKIQLGEFLGEGKAGPEHQALARISHANRRIGTPNQRK